MTYRVVETGAMASMTHVDGSMEPADPSRFGDLLDELEGADEEHPDVAVNRDDGWCLSVFAGHKVVWEDLDGDQPRWARLRSREEVLALMRDVLADDRDRVGSIAWRDGYG